MRYLRASLIFAGVALLAAPDDAAAQYGYAQPAPAPAPPPPEPHPTAPSTTVVVPVAPYATAPIYSPYGAAGSSRRVSRRTSRRVSRRH
jgi:hypothetical protein